MEHKVKGDEHTEYWTGVEMTQKKNPKKTIYQRQICNTVSSMRQ